VTNLSLRNTSKRQLLKTCTIFLIFLLTSPASAAVQTFTVPSIAYSKTAVTNPGNMMYRLDLQAPMKVGEYTCRMIFIESSDDLATSKFRLILAGYETKRGLAFAIDSTRSNYINYCHASEVTLL
jgi:hypothetical protein